MDCKHVNEHLVDYLYQELEADEAERIEGHLRQCEGCADELASFDSTRRLMQQLPQLDPSPAITEMLIKQAEQAVQPAAPGFWERVRAGLRLLVLNPAMTAVAALVLVLGVSFYAYRQSSPPGRDSVADLPTPDEIGSPAPAGEAPAAPAATAQTGTEAETRTDRDRTLVGKSAREESAPLAQQAQPSAPVELAKPEPRRRLSGRVARKPAPVKRPRARPRRYRKGPTPAPRANAVDDLKGGYGGELKLDNADGAAPRQAEHANKKKTGKQLAGTAAAWLARARKASKAGNCDQALRLYHRALEQDPGLRRTVGPEVRRCARVVAAAGLERLEKAQQQLPLLAGWLEAELSDARRRESKAQNKAAAERPKADKSTKSKVNPRAAPQQRKSYSAPAAD